MTPCILSDVDLTDEGYSRVRIPGQKNKVLAHRLAYATAHGPIAPGLVIDHLCRVRNCVAVEHLEAVTVAENNRRMYAARQPITACRRAGHPYIPDNVYVNKAGNRVCKRCTSLRHQARKVGGSHR